MGSRGGGGGGGGEGVQLAVQSPMPEAHDIVLENNPDRIGIWKGWCSR